MELHGLTNARSHQFRDLFQGVVPQGKKRFKNSPEHYSRNFHEVQISESLQGSPYRNILLKSLAINRSSKRAKVRCKLVEQPANLN